MSGGVEDGRSAPASIHIHQLYEEEAAEETADESEESSVAFCMWTLPALEFDGLWESLLYEEDVKPKLLRYVSTAMRFSELGVDARVVGWNRVVLLHVSNARLLPIVKSILAARESNYSGNSPHQMQTFNI